MHLLIILLLVSFTKTKVLKAPLIGRKFEENFERPESLFQLSAGRGKSEITNVRNQRYSTVVSLGSPAQNYSLMVDTGCSSTWIVGKECDDYSCDYSENYRKHKYDGFESESFINISEAVTIRYINSQIKGYAALEKMSINGISFDKQKIIVATELAEGFGKEENDGLIGFAWQYKKDTIPFIQNILPQLYQPIFTIWLNNQKNHEEQGGMLTLGDYDYDNCDSNINYHRLSSFHRWNLYISYVQIGAYQSVVKAEGICDTGAPSIGCPEEAYDELVRQMNGTVMRNGIVLVSCQDIQSFPDIIFTIDGINYKISSYQYIREYNDYCIASIFKLAKQGRKVWLLGDPWIRSYCHVYDMGRERIGLSQTKENMLSNF